MRTTLGLSCCLALSALFGSGCNRTYRVELLNRSGVSVTASLVVDRLNGDVLATADVAPGDFASLGPVEAPIAESVRLEAVAKGERGTLPVKLLVSPGLNEVEIHNDSGWGSIRLEPLRLGGLTPEDVGR